MSTTNTTPKTGYVNGSDILLYVNGKAIGHCTTHTTTFNSETKDRAVKPVATAPVAAGLWKGKGVVGLSVSITAEGLAYYGETETGFKDLFALWAAGQSVTVKCVERENDTKPYLTGKFVISSLEETMPGQDDTTYSITLENDGAPTIDTDGLTVSTETEG